MKARGEGDSTLSVFTRTSDAVATALAVHRALHAEPGPIGIGLAVRVAIHTGEAFERDGDFYGPTVNRAARIRNLAAGGQILISETAAGVVRDDLPDGSELIELGEQSLRDLSRPERVFAVVPSGTEPGTRRRVVARACPYIGLLAFQAEDHALFFGREQLGRDLADRLIRTGLVAVVGASGSGKSSLLRAGMVPAMGAAGDGVVGPTIVMTPGARPLTELAAQLARVAGLPVASVLESLTTDPAALDLAARQALVATHPTAKLLIVVDQFEELFTTCGDRIERETFVATLLDAVGAGRTAVAVGVRRTSSPIAPGCPRWQGHSTPTRCCSGPWTRTACGAAMEGPARVGGLTVEPGLTEVVLRDVAGEPGGLPLLSHRSARHGSAGAVRP